MHETFDVIIAGGGPAGATAAIVLARAGIRVCVLEKDTHPRFHIGESILPRTTPLLRELGIESRIKALSHVTKNGAEFGFGDSVTTRKFTFNDALIKGTPVFNIERSIFDKELLTLAREAGADVREATPVAAVNKLSEGDVEVSTGPSTGSTTGPSTGQSTDLRTHSRIIRARVLLDATGQGTLIGRKLNTRRGFNDPDLQKVAYFQHYEHVERLSGAESGHPCIVMCDEGWFWLIATSECRTSVGFVTRPSFVRTLGVPPTEILAWAVSRCPLVRHRMRSAVGPASNSVISDFSYRCRPYAGPGYFLIGDAACFLDPIFSTGVTLAMMSGKQTAELVIQTLRGQLSEASARKRHIAFIERSCKPFWRLIKNSYNHSFRELFLSGGGPMQMPGAIISILAGQVFPKVPWSLRWRHRLFDLSVWLQRYIALAPHRKPFSLVSQAPQPPMFLCQPPRQSHPGHLGEPASHAPPPSRALLPV